MALQFIGLFLFFTLTGASLSSGHLDFMSGAKKENPLHAKDPRVEIEDFSDSFKDIARSQDKMKNTFVLLNRPNDSRWKLDLLLIISKMRILNDDSQTLESKKNAWSVLYPVLSKYDQKFTYPADYDIESGEYMVITVGNWYDRYTQEKVAVKSSKKDAEPDADGSGHSETFESGNRELKSLMDGSGSFDEHFRSLEQEIEVQLTQEGSGSVEEKPVSEEDEALAGFLSEQATTTEADDSAEDTEDEASVVEVELQRDSRLEGSSEDEGSSSSAASFDPIIEQETTSEGYVLQTEEDSSEESENGVSLRSAASFDPIIEQDTTSEGYVLQTTEDSSESFELQTDGSLLARGYELHFTTEDDSASQEYESDDVQSSTQYQIVTTTDDEVQPSPQYRLVGTSDDDKELGVADSANEATTEYYVPAIDQSELLEILKENGIGESGEVQVTQILDDDEMQLQHRVGYAVEVHPEEHEKEPIQAGSIRGIPGVHFPDYDEIPITSFSCADKKYIPGFYADLETGCQVFHVCWPHRRESFLCPIGTLFNQAIMSCDYWYSTNCSLSPYYDDVNDRIYQSTTSHPPTHKPCPHQKHPIHTTTPPCYPEEPVHTTTPYHTEKPTYTTPSHHTGKPSHSTPSYRPEKSSHATTSHKPKHTTPSYRPEQTSHATPSYKPKHTTPSYRPEESSHATPSYKPKQPHHSTPSYRPKHSTTPRYHPEPPATPLPSLADVDWTRVISILPIKSKVYVYPPHQLTKTSKPATVVKHGFTDTAEGKALKKAIASQIVQKVLHAAETIAQSAQPLMSHIAAANKPPRKVGIPKINPKFVVRPNKLEDVKPILVGKDLRKAKKVPEIVMQAMEMAGTVLQKDILPLTRMALVEGSLKRSKAMKL